MRLFWVSFFALTVLLNAQTFHARVTGTVTDPAGAAIPAAKITARNIDTNISRSAESAATGVYTIPLLLPGNYEVNVEAPGMQAQLRRDVLLEGNSTATVDFQLKLAQVATTIEVSADVPLLQAESANVGNTVDSKIIDEIPLQQRDVMSLVRLMPGVIARDQVGDARGSRNVFDSNFSVGGGRTSTNEVLLDGATNTIGDFNGVAIVPPQDGVQEFRIEANSFSAEFGRTGGGVVNMITKSGTNRYNGTAYYYAQNDAFNANSFSNNRFSVRKQVLRRNQMGFSTGGPILIPRLYNGKNKTFFFAAYEGRKDKDPVNSITSVPTDLERGGDFSRLVYLAANGAQPITIYDPATSRIAGTARQRDPFPGNVIPAGRINPIAAKVLQEYPQPNRAGSTVTGRQNYNFLGGREYNRDVFSARGDHYLNDRHRIFGRFSWQQNEDVYPSKAVQFTNTNSTYDSFRNAAIDDTYQWTSRLSSVFRYNYTRFRANLRPNTLGFDPTTLGLPSYIAASSNILFYPNFNIGDGFNNIGGIAYNNQPRDTQGVQLNFVWVNGRHNLRWGAEFRLYRFYPFQVFNANGGFSFGRNFTQLDHLGGTRPEQGFAFASFLLGTGTFTFEHQEPLSGYQHYWAGYVQDDWKITRRLTVNLGLRWETEVGIGEAHDRIAYFDPTATTPIPNGPKGAIEFTGNGNEDRTRKTQLRNFGPRAGAAYRLTPRTALRAGFGLYFIPLGLEPSIPTTPYGYSVSADVLNTNYTPKTTLSNPFAAGIIPPASAKPPSDGSYRLNNNATVFLRDQAASYVEQWNFAIGRQLARTTVIDATYSSTHGVHVPGPSMELNQIDPKSLAQGGAYLNELVPNPYYDYFRAAGGLLSQQRIPRMQLLKPFPQFAANTSANAYGGSLIAWRPAIGDSIYHAVTLRFERRFTRGFSLAAHYTVSKLLDTSGVGNGAAFLDPSALRDTYNTRLERAVGSFDVPQRMVVYYSVNLPVGKGRKFFNNAGWVDHVIGGWSVFGYHTYQRGLPVNVGGPDTSRIAGASPSRASVVAGVDPKFDMATSIANSRDWDNRCGCTKPWFNAAAFVRTPEFVLPNGPRFLPNVRQGPLRNVDVTIAKSIRVYKERIRFSLQGRAYNVFNQTTFSGPSILDVTAANFGSAGGTRDAARRLEVGGKLYF
ncbi:MAG: carboxypeptidase regulatory-like domain-containing protein [Acidobacteria bacterium]|nr:carboxypeptidase regulatory-like domain-containing protein [Acidobacteriota bacterium]